MQIKPKKNQVVIQGFNRQKKPRSILERFVKIFVVVAVCVLIGYNLGLSDGREQAIPHDSTPFLDASALTPVRFVVSYRDTLESGLVIEVVNDLIWHNATITVKYFGNDLASATIDK